MPSSIYGLTQILRDQGATKIGIGKELCDLLVVFGRDIIVFSDKHCNLKLSDRPEVAWKRWYRDAVVRSAAQVRGAVRWLRQYPNRVYLDQKCGRRLPIALPSHPDFHRVLTCRGSADAAAKFWGGSSSLLVGNGPLAATDFPLQLGAFDEEGSLFHVFDEVALRLVSSKPSIPYLISATICESESSSSETPNASSHPAKRNYSVSIC